MKGRIGTSCSVQSIWPKRWWDYKPQRRRPSIIGQVDKLPEIPEPPQNYSPKEDPRVTRALNAYSKIHPNC